MSDLTREIAQKDFEATTEAERFWLIAERDGWSFRTSEDKHKVNHHFESMLGLKWSNSVTKDAIALAQFDYIEITLCSFMCAVEKDTKHNYLTSHSALRSVEVKLELGVEWYIFYICKLEEISRFGGGIGTIELHNYIKCTSEQKSLALAKTIHQIRRKELGLTS